MKINFIRLAALLFAGAATSVSAAIAPAEKLLPADTLAFFTVPDCHAFRVTCANAPQIRLWNDPAMKPFHDKFLAKFNEKLVADTEKDLGVKLADFLVLPQGQLTLAATLNGANGHDDTPTGVLLLLDAKDQSTALKTNLAALTKKWTDAGRALRTEKIHGLSFTVLPLNTNDFSAVLPKRPVVQELGKETKPEKPGEIYFTQFESLLVAGNSLAVVEAVAAHLTGGSAPAIADDPVFAADQPAQFRDTPLYYGWFNGSKLFTLLATPPADAGDDNPSPFAAAFNPLKIVNALGFGGLKSASIVARETAEGSAMNFHITAPEAGRTGLLKILALPAKDASVPAFVPADAVKFSRIRLDGKQTWAELQKMLTAVSPQVLAGVNSAIDMANGFAKMKDPGFDLRTALFGNLGDDIISYQKPFAGDSLAALSNPPMLYLVSVSNPDAVITGLKTIAGLATPQDATTEPRDFLGRKIYAVKLAPAPVALGAPATPRSLYLAASSSGYLALSTDTALVEEYLRRVDGSGKPLAENTALQAAAQHVGGAGGGMFGFENQRATMSAAFKVFKRATSTDASLNMFPPAFREWLDFSLLPDYELVQKYFDISVFAGSANADGLSLKVFVPHPPQLH